MRSTGYLLCLSLCWALPCADLLFTCQWGGHFTGEGAKL